PVEELKYIVKGKLYNWEELNEAFGEKKVLEIKPKSKERLSNLEEAKQKKVTVDSIDHDLDIINRRLYELITENEDLGYESSKEFPTVVDDNIRKIKLLEEKQRKLIAERDRLSSIKEVESKVLEIKPVDKQKKPKLIP